MTGKIWVVAADSSRARLFETSNSRKPLVEFETLTHPESRLHEGDLSEDGPGMVYESHGEGRHLTENHRKKHEIEIFAREVSQKLQQGRTSSRFDKLYLVAPPAFLGQLRDTLDAATRKLIQAEVGKNLVLSSPDDIRDHLPYAL